MDESADGRTLFVAGREGANIVDRVTRREVVQLPTERGLAFGVDPWSPGGKWVIGVRHNGSDSTRVAVTPDSDRSQRDVVVSGKHLAGVGWIDSSTYVFTHRESVDGEYRTQLSAVTLPSGDTRVIAQWEPCQRDVTVTEVSMTTALAETFFAHP